MPLEHSSSQQAFSRNVKTLMGDIGKSPHVKSPQQALAIAYETQRRAGRATGGVAGYDAGGAVQDVIAALQQGAGAGGVAPSAGGAIPAVGTSAQSTAAASAPSAMSQANPVATPTAAPATVMPQPTGVANPSASTPTLTAAAPAANPTGAAPAVAAAQGVAPASNVTQLPHAARGGGIPGAAFGGFQMQKQPMLNPSWQERAEARQMRIGPILSAVPGRTDNHRSMVPGGSYVLPAQHIASMGHGNTLAGMSLASKMFSGPYGAGAMKIAHGSMPRPPKMQGVYGGLFAGGGAYSEGGARGDNFRPVPVDLSGGEFVIPPWAIIQKFGSLKNGHKILDKWVMDTREKEIKTQKKLPPPAKRWMGGAVPLAA